MVIYIVLFPIFVAVWFIQMWYPNCLCKSCVLFPKSFRIVLFCELADKSNDKIEITFLPDLHLNCVLNFKFLDLLSYHFLILSNFFWSILFAPHHWLQRQIRLVPTTLLRCLLVLFAVIWRPCVCNHFSSYMHTNTCWSLRFLWIGYTTDTSKHSINAASCWNRVQK